MNTEKHTCKPLYLAFDNKGLTPLQRHSKIIMYLSIIYPR